MKTSATSCNFRRNTALYKSPFYKFYIYCKRSTIESLLLLCFLWMVVTALYSPVFQPIYDNSKYIDIFVQKERKFFCTRNLTSYNIDPRIISDLRKKFNNNNEQANSFILNELSYFQTNTDAESKELIGYVIDSILVTLNCNDFKLTRNSIQKRIRNPIREAVAAAKQKYTLYNYGPEVFWSQHGLRDANDRVLKYVRERDIVDIGAFCGDSLLVLLQYTDKTVFSFEYSPENIKLIKETIQKNNLDTNRIVIINKGISNEIKQIKTEYEKSALSHIKENENGDVINMTTIDAESLRYKMKVGFMKADIEGMELLALQGAVETIKKDRPIISFSIYHNFDGLFRIRHFIDEFPNYTFRYKLGAWNSASFGELIIFAYPNELD